MHEHLLVPVMTTHSITLQIRPQQSLQLHASSAQFYMLLACTLVK